MRWTANKMIMLFLFVTFFYECVAGSSFLLGIAVSQKPAKIQHDAQAIRANRQQLEAQDECQEHLFWTGVLAGVAWEHDHYMKPLTDHQEAAKALFDIYMKAGHTNWARQFQPYLKTK